MASQATQHASAPSTSGPKTRVEDDCIENIPPSDAASAAFVPKILIQAGGGPDRHVGTMSEIFNITRETASLSSAATPSVHSGNSGERGANLRSTLTPTFKYLRLELNRQRSQSLKPLRTGEDGSDDPNVSSLFREVSLIADEILPNCTGISSFDDSQSMSITFDDDFSSVVVSPAANTTVDLPCVPLETPVLSRLEEEMIDNQNNTFDAQSSMKLNGITEANGETFSVQNNTFNARSSVKLGGTSTEASGETFSLQNNTFNARSSMKLNGTSTEANGEIVSHQNSTEANGEIVSHQNNTFDAQSSMKLNGTTEANDEIVSHQNNTVDAQSSMKLSGTSTEASGETFSLQNNTFNARSSMKLNGTSTEANGEIVSHQNNTFDAQSSMKLNGTTKANDEIVSHQNNTVDAQSSIKLSGTSTEASGETFSLQNNTVDAQSSTKLNGTTEANGETFSVQNNTFDAQSSMKLSGTSTEANGETVSLQNNTVDAQSSMKLNGTTEANGETVSVQNNTFDAQSSVKLSGTSTEANDEIVSHQNNTVDAQSSMKLNGTSTEANGETVSLQKSDEAPTFNLNDTLELNSSSVVTSTPMARSKVFNFKIELESGKTSDTRTSLSACVLPKRTPQLPIPPKQTTQLPGVSNIVGDRKTFFQLPAVSSSSRSLRPSLRLPTQLPSWAGLPKTKPATAVSNPSEQPVSALTSIKRTTRGEASRNAAAAVSQEGPGILTVSSGRCSAVPESKLPCSGLRKPQPSGLRPPTARAIAASSNDKPSGSAATVRSKTKTQATSRTPKRLSTSTEALPVAKRKKLVPAGVKQLAGTLKLPAKAVLQAAKCPDECANCRALQQELEKYRRENEQLKEELQNRQMD